MSEILNMTFQRFALKYEKRSLKKKIEFIVFINFEFYYRLFRIYMNNKCYSVGVDIFSGGERHGVGPGLAAFAL